MECAKSVSQAINACTDSDYSVLMSVYCKEKAKNLCCAIESMLKQTLPPKDFVLVCDGPLTAELDAVVDEYCRREPELFQVLRLPENRGLGLALGEGMKLCRCELVARMDSDDIAVSTRMEMQIKALQAEPGLSAVGGQIAEFQGCPDNIIGYRRVPISADAVLKRLPKRSPMNHVTVTLRKSAVLAVGGYQHFPSFEDYHLWSRMLAAGHKMQNVEDICSYVRTDEGLYGRRGGRQYFRRTLAMERCLKELGMISDVRFLMNVVVRFVGTVLLPNRIRAFLYVKLLRKST